ncbi:MAG: hypothetical protein GY851_33640 [bacterium]|nr:hypothetical protein [bacterium]
MRTVALVACAFTALAHAPASASPTFNDPYPLEVLPTQAVRATDDVTGADLLYLTGGSTDNGNLYFHERSWLQDGSVILFYAHHKYSGLMGYIVATGELIRLRAEDGTPLARATAALNRPTVYAMAGNRVLEVALEITASTDPANRPSTVHARERVLCEMENCAVSLNESCDGRYLSMGVTVDGQSSIHLISTEDGTSRRLCGMPPGAASPVSHVQWSITNPNLLSFANSPIRIWVVDIRDGVPWAPYAQGPDELVTHEVWWVNDLIIFCGGIHPKPQEDAHVKTLDPHSGEVRIVGAGAWWPEATAVELARRNWWHPSGSHDGLWIAADNWHGDIMLFEGPTTRPRLLTQGHRTYGGGRHPEVGWDRRGEQVIFASHKLDEGIHVCVATIPDAWQEEVRRQGRRIEAIEGTGE